MQSSAAIRSLRLLPSARTCLLPFARASTTPFKTADPAVHSESPQVLTLLPNPLYLFLLIPAVITFMPPGRRRRRGCKGRRRRRSRAPAAAKRVPKHRQRPDGARENPALRLLREAREHRGRSHRGTHLPAEAPVVPRLTANR